MKFVLQHKKLIGTYTNRRLSNNKIAVGMSGGIDSSVTAYLLKKQGFDIIGVFMKNWDSSDEKGETVCSNDQHRKDAKEVCKTLDIPFHEVDFTREYWNQVFIPFLETYQTGVQTPNPDVFCNRAVKFNVFKKFINERFGVEKIATGHYCRVLEDNEGKVQLLKAKDAKKDQTYFLSMTKGTDLKNVIFPLGEYTKQEVRTIASNSPLSGLSVTKKKESMGICFIGKRAIPEFLSEYIPLTPGNFIDLESGQVLGPHLGLECYTSGQGAKIGGVSEKYYVAFRKKLPIKPPINCGNLNISKSFLQPSSDIYVVKGKNHPALFSHGLTLEKSGFNWITELCTAEVLKVTRKRENSIINKILERRYKSNTVKPWEEFTIDGEIQGLLSLECKVRHGMGFMKCFIEVLKNETENEIVNILFSSPLEAVNPGQIFVLYKDGKCLGGSIITSVSS